MRGKLELSNIVMVYLLGIVPVAIYLGRGPSILASVLSVAAFDFFFVPPYLHVRGLATRNICVTFVVMLLGRPRDQQSGSARAAAGTHRGLSRGTRLGAL